MNFDIQRQIYSSKNKSISREDGAKIIESILDAYRKSKITFPQRNDYVESLIPKLKSGTQRRKLRIFLKESNQPLKKVLEKRRRTSSLSVSSPPKLMLSSRKSISSQRSMSLDSSESSSIVPKLDMDKISTLTSPKNDILTLSDRSVLKKMIRNIVLEMKKNGEI